MSTEKINIEAMSKYFTKYLPAEGEIKEGDSIYFKDPNNKVKGFKDWSGYGEVYTIQNHHYMIDLGHTTTDASITDLTKVKLFLCSIDIPENWSNPHVDYWDGIKEQERYRIIGEISPDALSYVTEGQEFDKDELFLQGLGQNWDNTTPLSGKLTVKIKGSCGHFH